MTKPPSEVNLAPPDWLPIEFPGIPVAANVLVLGMYRRMAITEALADCRPEFDVKSLRGHEGKIPSYEELEVGSSNSVSLPVENPPFGCPDTAASEASFFHFLT